MQNPHFGSKIKIPKNRSKFILQIIQSLSVQNPLQKLKFQKTCPISFYKSFTVVLCKKHRSYFCKYLKCSYFFNLRCFLDRFFGENNYILSLVLFLICFWQFYFLTQTHDFAKAYSLCMEAIFANIQNALIFQMLGVL